MWKTILAILLLSSSVFAIDVPPLQGRVNDLAGIFTADEAQRLNAKLKAHEQASTDQIAILTIKGLDGDAIEDFSMRVAEAWKIGSKKNDNGVLIVYSPNDAHHNLRIEVGRGLEGRLNDGLCGDIIRTKFAPSTKAKRYFEGFDNGTSAIISAINGEYKADPNAVSGGSGSNGVNISGGTIAYIILMIFAFIITMCLAAAPHALIPGTGGGILGFVLTLIFVSFFWAVIVGIIGFFAGLIFKAIQSSDGYQSSGGIGGIMSSIGDSIGSSDFSSGGGGDSFSGGGGGFDGGGASGDA